MGMEEILRRAVITLRGMWKHRLLGLAVAWGVGVIALAVLMMMPSKYEASARIFVNTDSILKPLMTGLTVQPNDDQRIVMLSRVVISRPNVEKLVQTVGLDAEAKSKDDHERIIDNVMRTLEFKGTGRDNLYTLSFRDEDPGRAKHAIDLLASMFIASSKGGKSEDTEAAKRFIDEQIAAYEKKLQEAENRVKEFRLRYLGMTSGDGKDYFAQMVDTEKQLNQARLELREAERAREAFRRGLSAEEGTGANGTVPDSTTMLAEVEGRIDAMRRNLDGLLQRYTEDHPDVQGSRRVLRELEDQRRALIAQRKRDGVTGAPTIGATGLSGARAAETLKVSLAQTEAQVASLSTRVAEFSQRLATLKASAARVPQLEAEYAQLNRDYDVNKKNYESLVARRESANISGDMQSVAGVSDFRLVDPPRVSSRPVSPKRGLLFPLMLLLAIGAGFAAAYVAAEARPTYYDARALREDTGLPMLGVVSLVPTEERRRAMRGSVVRFLGGAGALVFVFVAGLVVLELMTARFS